MIAELALAASMVATTPSPTIARRWQIEAAGWERLAAECMAELQATRSTQARTEALLDGARERVRPIALPHQADRSLTVLSGALGGAGLAGGIGAAAACEGATCRTIGISVGVGALLIAILALTL